MSRRFAAENKPYQIRDKKYGMVLTVQYWYRMFVYYSRHNPTIPYYSEHNITIIPNIPSTPILLYYY